MYRILIVEDDSTIASNVAAHVETVVLLQRKNM